MWKKLPEKENYEDFIEMISTYQADFYRFAYMYVKNPENAMDVVQEATVKGLEKLHTLKEPSYLKTWFYRILVNESLNFIKKNQKILYMENTEETADLRQEDAGLIDKLTVTEAVGKLPAELRTIILLRFYEDMKISEMAEVLKMNENTVKAKLYRGIRELRGMLEKE
jgi:RNA polymerase sigma-70 factor (ECF subfamily)